MSKLIYLLAAFLLFFSYGCPFGSGEDLKMSTNKDFYSGREEVIVYLENERNSPAYFFYCNDYLKFHIERKEGDEWIRPFYDDSCYSTFYFYHKSSGRMELAPGEIDTIEIPFFPRTMSANLYRLAAPYSLEETEEDFPELLYSNEFRFDATVQ
jgi:hypothetical protein